MTCCCICVVLSSTSLTSRYHLLQGKHGIHVHVFGDFSDGFITGGGIFNPFGRNHGAPDDEERMVGDLGTVHALLCCLLCACCV